MSYKMVHQDKWYSGLFTLVIKLFLRMFVCLRTCWSPSTFSCLYWRLGWLNLRSVISSWWALRAEIWSSREGNTLCEVSCSFLAAVVTKMLSFDFHVFGFPRPLLRTALGWEPHLLPPNTWQTEVTGHISIYKWLACLGLYRIRHG